MRRYQSLLLGLLGIAIAVAVLVWHFLPEPKDGVDTERLSKEIEIHGHEAAARLDSLEALLADTVMSGATLIGQEEATRRIANIERIHAQLLDALSRHEQDEVRWRNALTDSLRVLSQRTKRHLCWESRLGGWRDVECR